MSGVIRSRCPNVLMRKSAWGNIYHFINYEKVKVALIVLTIFRLQNLLQGYRIHMDLFIYAIKSQGATLMLVNMQSLYG